MQYAALLSVGLPAKMRITLLAVTIRPLPAVVARPVRCSSARVSQEATTRQADDERYMRMALEQAHAAFDAGEVPIGAVLVSGSNVVSMGRNMSETQQNPLAHAELQCIMAAAERMQAWRLQDATLYCTVEPCPMCAGAILQARLQRLVYGARQPRLGADGSWVALFPEQSTNDHAIEQKGQNKVAPEGSSSLPTAAAMTPAAVRTTTAAQAAVGTTTAAQAVAAQCTSELAQAATSHEKAVGEPIKPIGNHPFHNTITVTRGVLEEECRELMVKFFRQRRQEQRELSNAKAAATAIDLAVVQEASRLCTVPHPPAMPNKCEKASQPNNSTLGLDVALRAHVAVVCVAHFLFQVGCNRTRMPGYQDPPPVGRGSDMVAKDVKECVLC